MEPTAAGERLYEHARIILRAMAAAEREIKAGGSVICSPGTGSAIRVLADADCRPARRSTSEAIRCSKARRELSVSDS